MAKGTKTGGRKRGTPNKLSTTMRENVSVCFALLGGVKALATWAHEHPTEFYTKVMPRLIPVEVGGPNDEPLPLRIELTDVTAPPPDTERGLS